MADPIDANGNLDRRTRTFKDLVDVAPRTEDILSEEIDGKVYAYKKEYRCKVCRSDPHIRRLIDTLLVFPKTYQETLDTVAPLLEDMEVPEKDRPSYWSIRNHQKRHLDFDKQAVREIVERRAADRGKSILNGKHNLLTAEAVYELIVQRGFQSIADRDQTPNVHETMQAAGLLDKLEKAHAGQQNTQDLIVQLNAIIEAVRETVPIELQQEIAAKLRAIKQREDIESLPVPQEQTA